MSSKIEQNVHLEQKTDRVFVLSADQPTCMKYHLLKQNLKSHMNINVHGTQFNEKLDPLHFGKKPRT